MSSILIHPSYFAPISTFVAIAKADKITFETEDNFQKQTNRSRMYIYSPNGVQLLNIPVKHSKLLHPKTKDVRIENDFDWQKQHFKSLEAAYRSSPFFEYFEDEFLPIYNKKHDFLIDVIYLSLEITTKCLRMPFVFDKTTEYFRDAPLFNDCRYLINGKKDFSKFDSYTQVFGSKHGFLNNLSIIDLLCNDGRFALDYLKNQTL